MRKQNIWKYCVLGGILIILTGCPRPVPRRIDLQTYPRGEGNRTTTSFSSAKKKLYSAIHNDEFLRVTFYCGSSFSAKKKLDHSQSGYRSERNNPNANVLSAEHVVPAERFGTSFVVWNEGHEDCIKKGKSYKGRKCAEKVSQEFEFMESDLYNLQPSIAEVNNDRSNYAFTVIPDEKRQYGTCNMEIIKETAEQAGLAEPPDERFGDIARHYFYMATAYPDRMKLSKKELSLFTKWNEQDPVDAWECERYRKVKAVQGNENYILKAACEEAGL